jgi:hypothetical protein
MAGKDRSGSGNWVPGVFAAFWILLAVFSAAYLFRIVTEPPTQRAESAVASPALATASPAAAPASALSDQEAKALIQANEAKDREIAELRTTVQSLSGQVNDLSQRLKPLERVLGPVAALPSSTAVTTSPPEPTGPIAKAPAAAAPPPPAVTEETKPDAGAAANEPAAPQPAAPADHSSAPAPHDTAAEAKPEAPAPSGEQPGDASPGPATADEPEDAAEPAPTETAALTPANIPPGTTRFGIEIGSVDKQDEVKPLWRGLLSNHAALVAGLQPRRVMAPDKKWRLIAGPFASAAEAMQACGLFKKADMPCEATVYAGDAF